MPCCSPSAVDSESRSTNPSSIRLVPIRAPHMTWARRACSTWSVVSRPAATSSSPSLAIVRYRPGYQLRDRDVPGEIHILDRLEQLDALLERALECLAAGDQAHTARALVDDGGHHGIAQV